MEPKYIFVKQRDIEGHFWGPTEQPSTYTNLRKANKYLYCIIPQKQLECHIGIWKELSNWSGAWFLHIIRYPAIWIQVQAIKRLFAIDETSATDNQFFGKTTVLRWYYKFITSRQSFRFSEYESMPSLKTFLMANKAIICQRLIFFAQYT